MSDACPASQPPAGADIPSVRAVLERRNATGSTPGRRTDPFRVVLCIEGGASRVAYASGMAMAFARASLLSCVDAIYGTSAGAFAAACLLSGSAELSLTRCWEPEFLRFYVDPRRVLRGQPLIDFDAVLDGFQEMVPDGFARILAHPVTLHPLATSVSTGAATDLHHAISDEHTLRLALCATGAMPVLTGRPVVLADQEWIDGGLSEPVPYDTPIRAGATHLLILRGRRVGELPPPPSWIERQATRYYLTRSAPNLLQLWADYHARRVAQERRIRDNPAGPRVLQIKLPPDAPTVSRLEKSPDLLRQAVTLGNDTFRHEFNLDGSTSDDARAS